MPSTRDAPGAALHGAPPCALQERHGLAALQVHQDRAIGVPFPQGEVIHPGTLGVGNDGTGCLPEPAQGVAAHHHVPRGELHPAFPKRCRGDQALSEPQRARRAQGATMVGSRSVNTAAAAAITTKPLADMQLEHTRYCAGQVRRVRP